MTVPSQTPINTYTASGATTVFAFSFKLLQAADLVVQVASVTKTLGVDYTIVIAGSTGGTVTFTAAPAAALAVTLYRDTAITRATDYQANGDFLSPAVNADFDRPLLIMQEVFNGAKTPAGAVRAPSGETIPALPAAGSRANYLLSFDSSGNPVAIAAAAGTATALTIDLASTAVGKGSKLVAFIQRLTGAVGRWVEDKLAEAPVSPEDFGADPTGATDSTAAIQAAFNTGKTVRFKSAGVYKTLSGLTLNISTLAAQNYQSQTIDLNGAGFTCTLGASVNWLTITGWPLVTGTHFIIKGGGARIARTDSNAGDCIKLIEGYGHKFENYEARSFSQGAALHIYNADITHWCESTITKDIRGVGNLYGIWTSAVGGDTSSSFDQTHIENCEFNNTVTNAIAFNLDGFHGRTTLKGCGAWIDESGATGTVLMKLNGNFSNATAIGCWADGGSTAANTITFGASYTVTSETSGSMGNALTVIGSAVVGDIANYLKLPTGWQYKLKVLDHTTVYGSHLWIDEVGGTGTFRNASPGAIVTLSGQYSSANGAANTAYTKTITLPSGVRRVLSAGAWNYTQGQTFLRNYLVGVDTISTTQVVFYIVTDSTHTNASAVQYSISCQMN
jgi:hypothetical protein